jgi:hypothetical protein
MKKELDAYMFKGYTRVGDGSYPNLLLFFCHGNYPKIVCNTAELIDISTHFQNTRKKFSLKEYYDDVKI